MSSSLELSAPLVRVSDTGSAGIDSCTIRDFTLESKSEYEPPVVCACLTSDHRLTINGTNGDTTISSCEGMLSTVYMNRRMKPELDDVSDGGDEYQKNL